METLQEITQFLRRTFSINLALVIAGVLGTVVSWAKERKMTRVQKSLSFISGGAVANYLTPVFAETFNAGYNTKYGIAFLLGYLGLKSVEICIDQFKHKFSNNGNS